MRCDNGEFVQGIAVGLVLAFFIWMALSMAYEAGLDKGKKVAMPAPQPNALLNAVAQGEGKL